MSIRSWWRRLLGQSEPDLSVQQRNEEAQHWLQDLRESELSVGAELRSGHPVTRAPGQTVSSPPPVVQARPAAAAMPAPAIQAEAAPSGDDGGNFLLSMAVAEVTDSALAGYAAGGDLLGAVVGEDLASGSSFDSSSSSDWL